MLLLRMLRQELAMSTAAQQRLQRSRLTRLQQKSFFFFFIFIKTKYCLRLAATYFVRNTKNEVRRRLKQALRRQN
jgi:hypothetical protein